MGLNFYNQNYDKCTIQGGCGQKPYVNFINEYIIKELKELIFYIEKLKKMNYRNQNLEKEIISFFAQINLNFDFHNDNLLNAIKNISERKKEVEEFYAATCKENRKHVILPKDKFSAPKDMTLNDIAKRGEKIFSERQSLLSAQAATLYTIYILLLKNMAKNLYEINTYGYDMQSEIDKIFDSVNKINIKKISENDFVRYIKDLYKTNYEITNKKYTIYTEEYGKISEHTVNFSSRRNKCILVSGRTLKDLDNVLKKINDSEIDVYTHNGMIFAYQYEKFANNKHLIGQFQKSSDSVKYDFSSFPGPIVMGTFQQNKFEGVYRGNLFTTNQIAPYGVSIVKDNDFSQVFEIAKISQGIQKEHQKNKITLGYDENKIDKILSQLYTDIKNNKYNSVLFIGLLHNEIDNIDYYTEVAKRLGEKTFIFSLAEELNLSNSIHINSCYDYDLALKIFKNLYNLKKTKEFDINVYITDCTSFITMDIMMLNFFGVKNIFIPQCKKLPNTDCLDLLLSQYFNTNITKYDIEEDIKKIQKAG